MTSIDSNSSKWTSKALTKLQETEFVPEIQNLLPTVVDEMNKLRNLTVDRSKSDEEQKKQAGFIQQRKRTRLNELFKTLQSLGFSYRFGVTNCLEINNYDEMFKHAENVTNRDWVKSEKYFFRCFARFRHLLSLLDRPDRAPPPDIGCNLNERFQGFVQHMMTIARNWRQVNITFIRNMQLLESNIDLMSDTGRDVSRSGHKFRCLLLSVMDLMETLSLTLRHRCQEYTILTDLKIASDKCNDMVQMISDKLSQVHTAAVFSPADHEIFVRDIAMYITKITNIVTHCLEQMRCHPISKEFESMVVKLGDVTTDLDNWLMPQPLISSSHQNIEVFLVSSRFYIISES